MKKVFLALSVLTQLWIEYNIVNSEVTFAESKNQFQCIISEDDTLIIKGDNLRFSDFLKSDNFTAFISSNSLKKIYIFALDTIYIDKDLSAKGQELMIYMIAPKWFVDGTITFDLSGLNGEPFGKAAEGFDIHGKGKSGSPGKPGGPGGIFFGVYSEIVNAESLTIDVGGGDGGKGQDGARGKDGKNGTSVNFLDDSIYCSIQLCSNDDLTARNEDLEWETFHCKLHYEYEISGPVLGEYCSIYLTSKCKIYPGDGGDGGQGGKGGFPGKITLLQLQNTNAAVKTKNETGKYGRVGLGGAPGKACRGGDLVIYKLETYLGFTAHSYWTRKDRTIPDSPVEGNRGKDGGNYEEPPNPKPAHFPILEYKAINHYKSYLIDNLKYTNKFNTLKNFLNKLNDEDNINEFCSAISLAEELLMVEKKRVSLSNDVNFLHLYTSLKYRIIKLAEKMRNRRVNQDTKLLSYIITATLSRIYNMKENSESRLIIDPPAFLDLVYNNICDLNHLENEEDKLEMVVQKLNTMKEYRNKYKEKLNGKITEAEKIAEEFVDEVHKMNDEIDKTVQSLIHEIVSLEAKEKRNSDILKKKRNKLQEQMVLLGFFGTIKFVASFGYLLGPIGDVTSRAVESMTGVIESIALDSESNNNASLEDLKETMNHIKEMVKKFKESDVKNISPIDDALKESKLLFEKLKKLELDVRNEISSQLEKMENTLDDIIEKRDKKSRVSLDVTAWAVQKLLGNITERIHTFVGELKLELEPSRRLEMAINNMKNTMNMLIKVYDHIQNYEDEKYLYDYIADVTSAAARDINIANYEYRKITNQLDVTISSNLILQQYEAAMIAFEQFVFPMADNYLKYFELPSQLEMKYDLGDLVTRSKYQIKLLKNKLIEYQGTVLNKDKCITKGYFYNDHKITAPFYTWDGKKHEDTFIKMLSGKEITLMADVINSPAGFDALKFTLIKLNFTSHNETLMKEIEEKLHFFEISMSHLGDSHYRLGNKYYRIDTDITEFSYSYKKELNGEPTFMSASYEKLKNGQLMLSPYALWRVKLRRYPTRRIREIFSHLNSNYTLIKRSIEYDENAPTGLEAFAKELIVEMVGKGTFVDTKKKDCNDFNVDKYYKPVNVTY